MSRPDSIDILLWPAISLTPTNLIGFEPCDGCFTSQIVESKCHIGLGLLTTRDGSDRLMRVWEYKSDDVQPTGILGSLVGV
eukprot:5604472-Amphidinium_carterae.2